MQQNNKQPPLRLLSMLGRLAAIGAILVAAAALFAFTAGWLSPGRHTQDRFMADFEAHDGKHPGFRRNHAKGVCVTGWFDAAAEAASLSRAAIFHLQRVPIVGRFALAGGAPFAADEPALVRSMALRFMPLGDQEWRTGMNDIPVFVVNSSDGFYDLLKASAPDAATGKPDPGAMQVFFKRHPEAGAAMQLVKNRSVSSGFADDTYNSLNAFYLTSPSGAAVPVRWSAVAMQPFVADESASHDGAGKNYLFDDLLRQLEVHALKWRLVFTLGEPGDPTQDATLPWPKERRQVAAGVITIARAMSEDSGACTDVNYDPTVLPDGISVSDDPLLAARASVYARSFTLRSAEKSQKPASAISPKNIGGLAP
jgi:catalase